MSSTFIKFKRSEDAYELLRDQKAFSLLAYVSLRAKRTDALSIHNLKPGQAFLGNLERLGMTEGEYRAAKKRLEKLGLVTFAGNPKGTIATLNNDQIFDINMADSDTTHNDQTTTAKRSGYEPTTTNKNIQEIKRIIARPPDYMITAHGPDTDQEMTKKWEALSEAEQIHYAVEAKKRLPFLQNQPVKPPLTRHDKLLSRAEFSRQHKEKAHEEKK